MACFGSTSPEGWDPSGWESTKKKEIRHEITANPSSIMKKGLKTIVLIDVGDRRLAARFFRSSRLRRGRIPSLTLLFGAAPLGIILVYCSLFRLIVQ
mmetsp:Transcript_19606/g.45605  ORF Transcript_19606/g.45605 Transcript_19606/m.45605 type:complete len:97 (-) Transcript_19606:75-365(-)